MLVTKNFKTNGKMEEINYINTNQRKVLFYYQKKLDKSNNFTLKHLRAKQF